QKQTRDARTRKILAVVCKIGQDLEYMWEVITTRSTRSWYTGNKNIPIPFSVDIYYREVCQGLGPMKQRLECGF
ncbi:unnamed protein product, partial [Amoebophrya sp. A120]